jgi:hypothetical protein
MNIISLGAGVQSSAMLLMSCYGELEKVDAAIFADTGAEPDGVYRHLEILKKHAKKSGIPLYTVSAGNLEQDWYDYLEGKRDRVASIPAFLNTENGGMMGRQCTNDYKIAPLRRKTKELLKETGEKTATIWMGITVDEVERMRTSNVKYLTNYYPLIEMGMNRSDCYHWYDSMGFERPTKSACTFCPYRRDAAWLEMKKKDPKAFQNAVNFDKTIRKNPRMNADVYIHRSMKPLDEVEFSVEEGKQLDMFINDCTGMCGV